MSPWVAAWERQADLRPWAAAVTNAQGQRINFSQLRDRAREQEHRLRVNGFDSGDRLLLDFDRKHYLDDLVVHLWACGLRRGVAYPDWSGFTRRQLQEWRLCATASPRMKVHPTTGQEEVFATPGPAWHDIAIAWPERALEGGSRHGSPMVIRKISHGHLAHGIKQWGRTTGIMPGDVVAWMDAGLDGLSWLSIFAALAHGAHLIQVGDAHHDDDAWLSAYCAHVNARWVIASPRWLSRAGLPWEVCPEGILAPWGCMSPAQRWRWGRRVRWVEAWCPAACGWWWGAIDCPGRERTDLALSDCTTFFPWKINASGGYLWMREGEDWSPMAMIRAPGPGRFEMDLCGLVDREDRSHGHALVRLLRRCPSIGAVSCGVSPSGSYVALLPRSHHDSAKAILEDAFDAVAGVDDRFLQGLAWRVAGAVIPRDERGGFLGARLADQED